MGSVRALRLGWTELVTNSTSDSFHPSSIWLPAFGLGSVRAQMEMRGKWGSGTVSIVPAYQLCNDERNPDAAVAIPIENPSGTPANYANADAFYDFASGGPLTISGTGVKDKIRFGWIVKVSSSNGGARVCAPSLELTY